MLCVHGYDKPKPQVKLWVWWKTYLRRCCWDGYHITHLLVLYDILYKDMQFSSPGFRPKKRALAQATVQPLPDLCGSLCEGGTKEPRKTRWQWQLEKHAGAPESVETQNNYVSLLTKVVTSAGHVSKWGFSVCIMMFLSQGKANKKVNSA